MPCAGDRARSRASSTTRRCRRRRILRGARPPQRQGIGDAAVPQRRFELGHVGVGLEAQRGALHLDARRPRRRLQAEQGLAQVGVRELGFLIRPQHRREVRAPDPGASQRQERDQLAAPLERQGEPSPPSAIAGEPNRRRRTVIVSRVRNCRGCAIPGTAASEERSCNARFPKVRSIASGLRRRQRSIHLQESTMNLALEAPISAPDFTAIKQRQQATWASGDYAVVGTTLQIVGEIARRSRSTCAPASACSTSPPATAMRRWPPRAASRDVTSTDYVPALLDKGRERARAEGLDGDVRGRRRREPAVRRAQASTSCCRPSARCSRPITSSTAREMMRVLRPRRPHRHGELDARRLHRPAVQGHRHARAAAGGRASRPRCGAPRRTSKRCSARPRRRSAASGGTSTSATARPRTGVQVFRDFYGPTHKAFAALDAQGPWRSSATSPRCSTR